MKHVALAVVLLFTAIGAVGQTPSQGDHRVRGHENKNGIYVAPHYQTNPNSTQKDNYGSTGRVNPHTGKSGTRTPKH